MAKVKTYQSNLYSRYLMRIEVDDVITSVEFEGGFKMGTHLNGGKYTTCNTSIQNAIEESKAFKNGSISCIFENIEITDAEAEAKARAEAKAEAEAEAREKLNEIKRKQAEAKARAEAEAEVHPKQDIQPIPYNATVEVVDSVTNRQEARIYFRDKGEQGLPPNLSDAKLAELTAKHNVTFPNFQIKNKR